MRKFVLIACLTIVFTRCSKDDTPAKYEVIKTQFSLQSPEVDPVSGHSFNTFRVFYSKSINSPIEAQINFTGPDFDTTFTVMIEANYKSAPAAFGTIGNVITGFVKEFKNETSKKVLSGKMLSIRAEDPKYKFEILSE